MCYSFSRACGYELHEFTICPRGEYFVSKLKLFVSLCLLEILAESLSKTTLQLNSANDRCESSHIARPLACPRTSPAQALLYFRCRGEALPRVKRTGRPREGHCVSFKPLNNDTQALTDSVYCSSDCKERPDSLLFIVCDLLMSVMTYTVRS